MEHQKNRTNRPRVVRKERQPRFHGYFAEVRDGEDPMRAYRRIKKKQKDDNFFEVLKEKQYFRKPSFIKREKEKKRKQNVLQENKS